VASRPGWSGVQMLLAFAVIVGSLLLWAVCCSARRRPLVAVFATIASPARCWTTPACGHAAGRIRSSRGVLKGGQRRGVRARAQRLRKTGRSSATSADREARSGLSDLLVGLLLLSIAVFEPC